MEIRPLAPHMVPRYCEYAAAILIYVIINSPLTLPDWVNP